MSNFPKLYLVGCFSCLQFQIKRKILFRPNFTQLSRFRKWNKTRLKMCTKDWTLERVWLWNRSVIISLLKTDLKLLGLQIFPWTLYRVVFKLGKVWIILFERTLDGEAQEQPLIIQPFTLYCTFMKKCLYTVTVCWANSAPLSFELWNLVLKSSTSAKTAIPLCDLLERYR